MLKLQDIMPPEDDVQDMAEWMVKRFPELFKMKDTSSLKRRGYNMTKEEHKEWMKEVIKITKPGEKDFNDIKSIVDLFDY